MISKPAAQLLHRALKKEAEFLSIHPEFASAAVAEQAEKFLALSWEERGALGLFIIQAISRDPELNLAKRRL